MKAWLISNNTIVWPSAANGLATGSAVQSATLNQTTDLALDNTVRVKVTTAAGGLGSPSLVYIYAFGSNDNVTFPGGLGPTAAAYTMPTNVNFYFACVIMINTAAVAEVKEFSLAQAFGGTIPPYWGLVAVNSSGLALAASTALTADYTVWQTQ